MRAGGWKWSFSHKLMGNGRQNHKFSSPKNRGGILLYCACADGNACGRKSRGDEKQLIDLEWPYSLLCGGVKSLSLSFRNGYTNKIMYIIGSILHRKFVLI